MLLIFVFTWSVHYEKALNSFMTKAVIICRANQWTGFYMITASVVKDLKVISAIKHKNTAEEIIIYAHRVYSLVLKLGKSKA